jgi:hypothetical protein
MSTFDKEAAKSIAIRDTVNMQHGFSSRFEQRQALKILPLSIARIDELEAENAELRQAANLIADLFDHDGHVAPGTRLEECLRIVRRK